MPELWADIYHTGSSIKFVNKGTLFKTFLQRGSPANTALLNVKLDLHRMKERDGIWSIRHLTNFQNHLRSLDIVCGRPDHWELLGLASAPHLSELILRTSEERSECPVESLSRSFAPNLQRLTVDGVRVAWEKLITPSLVALTIRNASISSWSPGVYHKFFAALQEADKLAYLEISLPGVGIDFKSRLTVQPTLAVEFPLLNELILHGNPLYRSSARSLTHLFAPQLRRLTVDGVIVAWDQLITPSLIALTVTKGNLWPREAHHQFFKPLREAVNITYLDLAFKGPGIDYDPEQRVDLPQLYELILRGDNIALFLGKISASSLKRLTLRDGEVDLGWTDFSLPLVTHLSIQNIEHVLPAHCWMALSEGLPGVTRFWTNVATRFLFHADGERLGFPRISQIVVGPMVSNAFLNINRDINMKAFSLLPHRTSPFQNQPDNTAHR